MESTAVSPDITHLGAWFGEECLSGSVIDYKHREILFSCETGIILLVNCSYLEWKHLTGACTSSWPWYTIRIDKNYIEPACEFLLYRIRSATKDTLLLYFALVKSICGWILVAWMGGWKMNGQSSLIFVIVHAKKRHWCQHPVPLGQVFLFKNGSSFLSAGTGLHSWGEVAHQRWRSLFGIETGVWHDIIV